MKERRRESERFKEREGNRERGERKKIERKRRFLL